MLSFGKYKGQSIPDIYQRDRSYLEWLTKQPWFQRKFKDIHQTVSDILEEVPVSNNSETTVIYTDGSCKNNGSKEKVVRSGVGVHFRSNNPIHLDDVSIRFPLDNPTNNRAELYAIRIALQLCLDNGITQKVVIYTDSGYSLKCITEWYPQWSKQGDLKDKKNLDILSGIHQLTRGVDVIFRHIRSHTGLTDEHSLGNERADHLANQCL